ncbi:oxidoreductase [Ramaria rubella]|nr:oxidoreductase [Ramaria rubella]
MFGWRDKRWSPEGKHCYVTGGSSGTGKCLAILLTKKGAHVSIVARDEAKLEIALQELEAVRQHPEQILRSYSFSLNNAQSSQQALEAACAPHGGKAPAAVFTCAGSSRPSFFIEQTEQLLLNGMTASYWVQAWTALAATKQMVRDRVQGKIIFVASTLGFMNMIGYSSYSPGKHALRGLAEGLRSELILYGIDVHCFFPCTIFTPGNVEENKTKPDIVKKLEEVDPGLQPEQVAAGILKGVINDQHQSAADFVTNVFRASTRGTSPRNNILGDLFLSLFGWIAIPVIRYMADKAVRDHRAEHEEYLTKQGFFSPKS